MSTALAPVREPLAPMLVPFHYGPTWQTDEDGDYLIPRLTLGWWVIGWIAENLQLSGEPIVLTPEQERLILWIYAIDEHGYWLYQDIVVQRLKGWGKDPLAAILCAVEFIGPCRFSHFATAEDAAWYREAGYDVEIGDPIAKEEVDAWIQIVATASEQTKNTAALLMTIFNADCRTKYGLDIGKQKTYSADGRRIEIASSSWRTMEGNRPTFVVRNETHHWRTANEGDELHQVIRRNVSKNPGGLARSISITNAYRPGEGSVGELQRSKYEEAIELRGVSPTLYDTLESAKGTPLVPTFTRIETDPDGTLYAVTEYDPNGNPVDPSFDTARRWISMVIDTVRGDARWLRPERLADDILTGEVPGEEALRFYFNSSETAADTYLTADDVTGTRHPDASTWRRNIEQGDPLRIGWNIVKPDEPVAMFGDGSKSNDATALVGVRLSDGYMFTLGIWQRPAGSKRKVWLAPRDEVDARVDEVMARFNVVGFWFDPSHTKDDEDGKAYWDTLCDEWHRKYGDRLQAWATITGDRRSSVAWDMVSPQRQIDFVAAVARFQDDMGARRYQHDGHPALERHMLNARNFWTKAGWSISKSSRGSKDKIDLCVCAVGAQMLRRVLLNKLDDGKKEKGKPAEVWW